MDAPEFTDRFRQISEKVRKANHKTDRIAQ